MLLSRQPKDKQMKIKVLKLVTGEEIITQLKSEDENTIVVVEPQKFIMSQEGVGSMPLMPMSKDKEYSISKNHVVLISEPDDDIKNVYNSKFGSGVVIPTSSTIITG
jgi:hypothetical protein